MLRNDCKPDGLINRPPVYKPVSQFVIQLAAFETTRRSINWPNSLQAGQTVYKLAERLVPRMNGRSCNHFHTRGSLPSAIRVFQQRWQSNLTPEPHRLYYVCCLWAPCWLYLVASFSHVFIIIHVKVIDWSVTADWPSIEGLGTVLKSHPVHVQASFLTAPAYWPTFWLSRFLTLRTPDWF